MRRVSMSAADELYEAYVGKAPIELGSIGVESVEDAYRIQDQVLKMKINDNGETLRGYKISLTSEETQKMFNHDEPLYGVLTNRNLVDNARYSDYNAPRQEMEIAF